MAVLTVETPYLSQCFPAEHVETVRRVKPAWWLIGSLGHVVEVVILTGRVYRFPCRTAGEAQGLYVELHTQLQRAHGIEEWE
jgi:hypothetical protein